MKSSYIYLISELLIRGIPFFTLPIFVSLLSKTDYGIMALYLAILPFASLFIDLSQRISIKRFYFDYRLQIDNFLFTIILFCFMGSVLLFNILTFFDIQLIKNIDNRFFILNILFIAVIELFLSKFQISKDVIKYNIYYFIKNALPYLLAIGLLYFYKDMKYYSIVYSQTIIFLFLVVILIIGLIKVIDYKQVKQNYKKYLRYSLSIALPTLPVVLSAYALSVSDRYMIEYFYDSKKVAEYSVVYTIAMIVQMVVLALGKAWQPFIFEKLKLKDYKSIYKNGLYYILFIVFVALFIYILDRQLLLFLANDSYLEALTMMPYLLFGMFFFFLYSMMSNVLFYHKKMFLFGLPAMIAAILNIVLNYIFLPKYDYEVAAITTMVSYFIEFIIIGYLVISITKKVKHE